MTTARANVLLGLLVVVLSFTLFLPILRHWHRSQARAETLSRLRDMGLALHNFESTHKKFPPCFDTVNSKTAKSKQLSRPTSIHVHLLPFTGNDKIYQTFVTGPGDDLATVAAFLAPSDVTHGNSTGVQNFAANLRLFSEKGCVLSPSSDMPPLGPIEPGSNLTIGRIARGSSNVIAFATKLAVCGQGGSHYAADPTSRFAAFFGQNHAEDFADAKDAHATFQLAPHPGDCCASPLIAQSFEATGLGVGLADAHALYIAPTIDPERWNSLLSPIE
jgi:hypothetical protein